MTTVVNKRDSDYDIYCGRGSLWGNPYVIGKHGTREEVIAQYREWFDFVRRDPIFRREMLKLKDKRLACYCKPLTCHVDIIAEYLNNL